MSPDASVTIGKGPPETVLPPPPPDWQEGLAGALRPRVPAESGAGDARSRVAAVAAAHPRFTDAWVELVALARDDVEAYAYARVGYHRGLDALRGAGWHGSGYVRWRHPSNRGFLRAVEALRRCASTIGETDEEERCALFLRQLDPDWRGLPAE
ncbi:MAG TPA: DUF3151 family protein [Acidimicrobiales bacterium]|nr:DUF3151 family protein [Acidimicrobiales bacterium]